MTYSIIGSGNVGTALARQFARSDITVGIANTRGPDSIAPLAKELGAPHITTEPGGLLTAEQSWDSAAQIFYDELMPCVDRLAPASSCRTRNSIISRTQRIRRRRKLSNAPTVRGSRLPFPNFHGSNPPRFGCRLSKTGHIRRSLKRSAFPWAP